MCHPSVHRLVMGNLLVRSWCKVGNAGSCVSAHILQLLSHALTGVVFLLRSDSSTNIVRRGEMKKLLRIIAAAMALIVAASAAMAEPKNLYLNSSHEVATVSTCATSSMASQQSNIQGIRGT